jgi:hypothetical protein
MKLKHVVAICILAAMPGFALAQKPAAPAAPAAPSAPKPTKADIQKVVATIIADKAKTKVYCDITKLEQQLAKLDEKKDAKKIEDLGRQSQAMEQKLGPEYVKVMDGMQDVDPDSAEGKDLYSALEPLDKACGKS